MRKNISKVIMAFRYGKYAKGDSKATCWTDGTTIYSYQMPIARRVRRPGRRSGILQIVEYDRAPSATTRSQLAAVRNAFKYDFVENLNYKITWVQKIVWIT
jgi:hypothetical protein